MITYLDTRKQLGVEIWDRPHYCMENFYGYYQIERFYVKHSVIKYLEDKLIIPFEERIGSNGM